MKYNQYHNDTKGFYIIYSITGFLLLTTLLASFILSNSKVKAVESSTDSSNVSVTVNSACTLYGGSNGTDTSGSSIYSTTIDPGSSKEISGSKLVTLCNDPNGYSVYAIGYSTNAYTTPTNTQMIGTGGIGNIDTGLKPDTPTTSTPSSWSMKLEPASGVTAPTILNGFGSYHVVPATYTQIAKYTSSTTTPTSEGAAIQTKYQIYIASGQTAGTYTGKVKYTMVHPNDAAAPTTKTIADATYMQEVVSCPSTLTTGMVYQLTDNRDNQQYLVAKLKDGNCWMLQNLKLGRTVTTQNPTLTLTPTNSNVSSNYTLNYSDIPSGGKFHAYTIDGVPYQNNSTEYYCTGDGTASDWESCYYNWYTATAGTGTTYIASDGQSVANSICPAGWALPDKSELQALYNQYPSAAEMEVANPTTTKENTPTVGQVTNTPGFLFTGNYNVDGSASRGFAGSYWTHNVRTAQNAVNMYISPSAVRPTDGYYKYIGFTMRCVLQP